MPDINRNPTDIEAVRAFVEKPINKQELAETIRDILEFPQPITSA